MPYEKAFEILLENLTDDEIIYSFFTNEIVLLEAMGKHGESLNRMYLRDQFWKSVCDILNVEFTGFTQFVSDKYNLNWYKWNHDHSRLTLKKVGYIDTSSSSIDEVFNSVYFSNDVFVKVNVSSFEKSCEVNINEFNGNYKTSYLNYKMFEITMDLSIILILKYCVIMLI